MYGADELPLMLDQSVFSIRMRNTVRIAPDGRVVVVVAGGRVVDVVVVVDVVEGPLNGPQVNAQLMSPTSHCAILRASSMLQAPSPLTSQASGWMSWLHGRIATSNSATTNASPMLTIPSPFTSPQVWMVAVPETAGVCWKTCPGETPGLPAGFWQTPTPACLQRPSTFFRHTRGRPPTPMHTPILSRHARRHCRPPDAASAAGATGSAASSVTSVTSDVPPRAFGRARPPQP